MPVPVLCFSVVPCCGGRQPTERGEEKGLERGQPNSKIGQFLQLPAPGIQHRSSTSPSVVGGVRDVGLCRVTVKGAAGFAGAGATS